jgi:hypothetical protein
MFNKISTIYYSSSIMSSENRKRKASHQEETPVLRTSPWKLRTPPKPSLQPGKSLLSAKKRNSPPPTKPRLPRIKWDESSIIDFPIDARSKFKHHVIPYSSFLIDKERHEDILYRQSVLPDNDPLDYMCPPGFEFTRKFEKCPPDSRCVRHLTPDVFQCSRLTVRQVLDKDTKEELISIKPDEFIMQSNKCPSQDYKDELACGPKQCINSTSKKCGPCRPSTLDYKACSRYKAKPCYEPITKSCHPYTKYYINHKPPSERSRPRVFQYLDNDLYFTKELRFL